MLLQKQTKPKECEASDLSNWIFTFRDLVLWNLDQCNGVYQESFEFYNQNQCNEMHYKEFMLILILFWRVVQLWMFEQKG